MSTLRKRTAGYLFVSLIAVSLAWWGCGGGTDGGGEENPTSEAPPTGGGETPTGDASIALGQHVYAERCAMCHGDGGKGDGPAGKALNPPPRDHTDAKYMNTLTDDDIRTTILSGKGAMPPHQGILTDTEVASLVMYVRSLSRS